MKKIYLSIALLIFLFFAKSFELHGQSGGCGTSVTPEQKNLESAISITEGNPTASLPQLNKTLTINVYVIKNDKQQPGVSPTDIQSSIDKLNGYFQPIALKFKICNTTYIDNYQLDNLSAASNESDLVSQFSEKNTINLYLATKLSDNSGTDVCGYTYMPSSGKNTIFIKKGCLSGSTLVHQMGHFLNLYHTHETAFGNELVNRTNCSSAGDKCCDTEADPGLEGLIDKSCLYTGKLKDTSGAFYQPKPKNIMSFSNDDCRCNFSRTQFLRIIYTLQNLKKDLR
jgi:hypothetical protein